jgi:hypothetical protein
MGMCEYIITHTHTYVIFFFIISNFGDHELMYKVQLSDQGKVSTQTNT